jgi:hypothetical protein
LQVMGRFPHPSTIVNIAQIPLYGRQLHEFIL